MKKKTIKKGRIRRKEKGVSRKYTWPLPDVLKEEKRKTERKKNSIHLMLSVINKTLAVLIGPRQ